MEECPSCDSQNITKIKDIMGYIIIKCNDCGLLY